jgi:RNA-directed DNA polymerase
MKQTGKRSAGKPHAAFDVAGVGNVTMVAGLRSLAKAMESPPAPNVRAPALDPTGFEFLGYKIKSGWKKLNLPENKIRSQARQGALYAYPKEKSIRRFMDQVRQRTTRLKPLNTTELIAELNPLLRGWGEYYKRAQVRKLFQRLDGWILRRIWSHRFRRWRNPGWKQLPAATLHGEYKLVRLLYLIPSLASWRS